MTRRHALFVAFWVPILGAMSWSYPHLVAWFRPWAPAGWQVAAHGAALMLDALILAALLARSSVPHGQAPAAVDHALWAGVGLSVYVNLRYGLDQRALPGWVGQVASMADLLIGSAIAPALAMLGHRALDEVLHVLPVARGKAERKLTTQAAPVVERKPEPVAMKAPQASPASHPLAAKWRALVAEHGEGKTLAQLAEAAGVSRQAVGQWRRAAGES